MIQMARSWILFILLGFGFFLFPVLNAPAATNVILLTGFWPPSNEVLREWSKNPVQNPTGWRGENFEGSGYDVVAYFPEYPRGGSVGEGDFRVDFAAVFNDLMRVTAELKPIAMIGFGLASQIRGWRVETEFPNYFLKPGQTQVPSQISVPTLWPIPPEWAASAAFRSSLPTGEILTRVSSTTAISVSKGEAGSAGDYVCGFTGYLMTAYQMQHSRPDDPAQCLAAGFIHIGPISPSKPIASDREGVREVLRALIQDLIARRK